MKTHIGKAILEKLKKSGMSKSEFARRINKSPQNVQDIFTRQSIDTMLLSDISNALEFNFFILFLKEIQIKQLGDVAETKGQLRQLSDKNEKLTEVNNLLKKNLKDKEHLIALLTKKEKSKKK
jgi:transcriptional regulator with XRE-family HTH domain